MGGGSLVRSSERKVFFVAVAVRCVRTCACVPGNNAAIIKLPPPRHSGSHYSKPCKKRRAATHAFACANDAIKHTSMGDLDVYGWPAWICRKLKKKTREIEWMCLCETGTAHRGLDRSL
uniref:Uncharacterized protein n=1 Tax=Anopheles minimus TaxID=112268 RepID=A0A182WN42_9DIPT